MKALNELAAAAFAAMGTDGKLDFTSMFGGARLPMVFGGYTKADWTRPRTRKGTRFSMDTKHRKNVLGNRANVKRMQALKRKGRWVAKGSK